MLLFLKNKKVIISFYVFCYFIMSFLVKGTEKLMLSGNIYLIQLFIYSQIVIETPIMCQAPSYLLEMQQ